MSKILAIITENSKKVALYGSLFLAVFAVLFYLVNMDLGGSSKPITQEVGADTSSDLNGQLKKRLGDTAFSVESYDDWAKRYNLYKKNSGLDMDPDKDGLPNYLEYVHGTDPLNADTDGDKYSDKQEIINGFDPDAPGEAKLAVEVSISKIGVTAPMVWSKSDNEKNMLKDLENGVSHFDKTSSPGQNGNAIISGHSSNYVWAKGNYNHIFKDLQKLEKGDMVDVRTTQANGRIITFRYKITDKFITTPDDQRIFAPTEKPTLTLTTCWPVGTALKRTIIKADLI